jgi:hypothetical protein
MMLPFYSTIKAWFILCLLPAFAVLTALGLQDLSARLGRVRFLIPLYLLVFAGLVVSYFWIN